MVTKRLIFFFSSRRRHTRLTCDWSSDVCSADLAVPMRDDGEAVVLLHFAGEVRLRDPGDAEAEAVGGLDLLEGVPEHLGLAWGAAGHRRLADGQEDVELQARLPGARWLEGCVPAAWSRSVQISP